jgi:flagella basal body P-ring formation protein FlgA
LKLPAVKRLVFIFVWGFLCAQLQAFEKSDALAFIQAEVISRNAFLKPTDIQIQISNWIQVHQKLVELPRNSFRIEMQFAPGVRLLGKVVVPLKIIKAHDMVEWVSVYAQIDANAPLCVAARNLSAKIKVESNMLEQTTKNITALPGGFVRSCASLLSLETALYVQNGAVLYAHQFREVPQIRAQESVVMQFSREGVYLKMDGVALEDGAPGQVIAVKNTRSGKKLKGRVTGFRTVEIVP